LAGPTCSPFDGEELRALGLGSRLEAHDWITSLERLVLRRLVF
jgi:hypothetical protein